MCVCMYLICKCGKLLMMFTLCAQVQLLVKQLFFSFILFYVISVCIRTPAELMLWSH